MKQINVDCFVEVGLGAPTLSLGALPDPPAHFEVNFQDSVVVPGRRPQRPPRGHLADAWQEGLGGADCSLSTLPEGSPKAGGEETLQELQALLQEVGTINQRNVNIT